LFFRESVATLGIAPLTSMCFFGENQPHRTDFHPEVHDSDGLLVATSLGMSELRGFGRMQRDRNFHSYKDPEASYELRPGAWVEPIGLWGVGGADACGSRVR
jgi:glucans biosynthesis protein